MIPANTLQMLRFCRRQAVSYAGDVKEDIIKEVILTCSLKNEQEISVHDKALQKLSSVSMLLPGSFTHGILEFFVISFLI